MIYGLHTKELPRHLLEKIETYMYKQVRPMINPKWEKLTGIQKSPTIQETAAVGDGIMARPNANHDNDDAEARHPNDTSNGMQ